MAVEPKFVVNVLFNFINFIRLPLSQQHLSKWKSLEKIAF